MALLLLAGWIAFETAGRYGGNCSIQPGCHQQAQPEIFYKIPTVLIVLPGLKQKYCNELTMLQSIINGYVLNLAAAKTKAGRLVALLQKKHKIRQ